MSTAQRYLGRCPRYTLRVHDFNEMRFATMASHHAGQSTRLVNLSESGLAFALGSTPAPEEGEILKVEFSVPGFEQIACFATVVRIYQESEWLPDIGDHSFNVVGLQFRYLPSTYRKLLRKALHGRVDLSDLEKWVGKRQILSFAGLSVGIAALMYVMVLPLNSWLIPLKALFS